MWRQYQPTRTVWRRRSRSGVLLLVLLVLSACTGESRSAAKTPTMTPTVTPTVTPLPLGAPNCQPPSPITPPGLGFRDVRGTITSGTGELWALPMGGDGPSIHAQQDVKIVWRMTGFGDFQIVALGPAGARAPLLFGPDKHLSSNWQRPGEEWGTGFHFPVAGCWDLHATRDSLAGDVWLLVVP
jgi:hypothetical protein